MSTDNAEMDMTIMAPYQYKITNYKKCVGVKKV